MKYVFVINGSGGSGKDTFIEFISHFSKVDIGWCGVQNWSSIDPIKDIAKQIGWDGKTEKGRKFLCDLKQLSMEYNNYLYNATVKAINEFLISPYEILFLHIREPEEIAKIKEVFPIVKTVLMKNLNVDLITSNDADKRVFEYKYDVIINNKSDLNYLKNISEEFYDDLKEDKLKDEY